MTTATITRATGDETPVKILWSGTVDLTSVTSVTIRVFATATGGTPLETLTGEKKGFDPGTFFPVIDANWTGTRYWQIVISRGAEDQPLPELHKWTQR
jgi:hypothetical protein